MFCVRARGPYRVERLALVSLLLAALVVTPLYAQDEQVPHRVGPAPRTEPPKPLLDLSGDAAAELGGTAGEGGGTEKMGIDPISGAFVHSELEVFQPGLAGLDFSFERTHLSNAAYNGPLGWNWDSSLFMRIRDTGANTAAILYDGRFDFGSFAFAGGGGGGGVARYTTPNGWFYELTRSGGLYSLMHPQGNVYRFELDVQQGSFTWYRLKDITDPNGNRIQYAYHPTTKLLTSITDSVGNVATLAWHTSGANSGRLQSFTGAGGATVTFLYDAVGNLVTARRPAPDNTGGNADETMTYDGAHRLVSIKSASASTPWLVNGYDGSGRIISQQTGGPGHVSTVSWATWPAVPVTDPLGQISDYLIDPATGDILMVSVRDMSQPGTSWTTTFAWDAHHHLVREVRPHGETFEWTYETSGDPKRRDNLLRFEHKISVSAPSGLLSTWSYTAAYNRVAWEMTPRANATSGGAYAAALATNMTYDTRGNLTQVSFPAVTTPSGPQTTTLQWAFDARGRVTQFTGPRGLLTTMAYADGAILRPFATSVVTDPAGVALSETFAYDSINRLVQSTQPCACGSGSTSAAFTYDAGRRLREVVVDLDATTQRHTIYDHDLEGRTTATRVQDDSPAGDGWAVNSYAYGLLGHVLSTSEDVDAATVAVDNHAYDADWRLIQSVSPAGVGHELSYDERNLVVERRLIGDPSDPNDDVAQQLQHDAGGRVVRLDRADGTFETYTWDGYSRLATVTDSLGRVTSYTWDADGNMLTEELHAPNGDLLDLWTMEWDELGQIRSLAQLARDDQGQPLGGGDGMLTTSVERDPAGNVTVIHREDGAQLTRTWDLFDRLIKERDGATPASGIDIDYHASGLPYRLWAVEGDPATGLSPRRLQAEWTSYDRAGRPTQVRDALGNPATYAWTLSDQVSRYVDRNGQRVDMTWDERGQMLSHRRLAKAASGPGPDDLLYEYGYDLDGRDQRTTARNAPFGPDQVTWLLYDDFGALDTVLWPDGSQEHYTYDTALRVAQFHDTRGNLVNYAYDAASRLADRLVTRAAGVGGTTAEHFEYDLRDNMTLARNNDYDILRTHDTLGDVQTETTVDRLSGLTRSTRADYDPSGRLARLQYPSHTAASPDALWLGWDSADRLISLTKQEGATSRSVAQFQWMGERMLRRWGPTLETLGSWDALGRPASVLHRLTANAQSIARFDLRYDAISNVTGVLRTFYDAAGNALPDGASGGYGGGQGNVYDAADRLVASRGGISTTDWLAGQVGSALLQSLFQYDRNENRTTETTSPAGAVVQYVAGAINQYLSVGGASATHDAAGNLLSMPGGPTNIVYDYTNRPVSWTEGGITDVARYDALGRRISTGDAFKAEVYTYFDFYPLEQLVAGYVGPVREFVWGEDIDDVLEVRAVGIGEFPVASNEQGSPVALLAPNGGVLESYRYSTFGRRFAASPSTGAILPGPSSPLGFAVAYAGRPTMNGSDALLDFRARTYLPDWGRFAEQDPLGYPDGRLNRYGFAGNNPWRKDNFGLHDPGHPHKDPPGKNTHCGISRQAGEDEKVTEDDNFQMRQGAWFQDNSANTAWLPERGNRGSFSNHFKYHALGGTEETQAAQLRKLIEEALDFKGSGWCNTFRLGWALHYTQDMVSHRTLKGEIYPETWGHAIDTVTNFDPDGPEDPTGNEELTRWENHGDMGFGGRLMVKVTYQRNPHGYVRHLRKLEAIKRSRAVIKEFMDRCGPGTDSNYWPRYRGGRPKPEGPTTGGKRTPKPPTTGGPAGPTTGGSGGGEGDTCGQYKPNQPTGPTTGGKGRQDPPTTGGPSGPTTGVPPQPSAPAPGGPTTGGPKGPTTPRGKGPPNPQGPTTPGSGSGVPITPNGATGPEKPAGGGDGKDGGGG